MSATQQAKQNRDRYSEMTVYGIMGLYHAALEARIKVRVLLSSVLQKRQGRVTEEDKRSLYEGYAAIMEASAIMDELRDTYLVEQDRKKVLHFADYCKLLRTPDSSSSSEQRARMFELTRDELARELRALEMERDALREVAIDNRWFELSHRPEPRPHGGPGLGSDQR